MSFFTTGSGCSPARVGGARGTPIPSVYVTSRFRPLAARGNDLLLGIRGQGNTIIRRDDEGRETESERLLTSPHFDDMSSTTNTFYDDGRGNLWLGTRDGLFRFEEKSQGPFVNLKNDVESSNTPSHNTVSDIWIEERNTVWLATAYGLNRMTFDGSAAGTYRIERFFAPSGDRDHVSSNKIERIELDADGMMWLGTKTGIRFFNPGTTGSAGIPRSNGPSGRAISCGRSTAMRKTTCGSGLKTAVSTSTKRSGTRPTGWKCPPERAFWITARPLRGTGTVMSG